VTPDRIPAWPEWLQLLAAMAVGALCVRLGIAAAARSPRAGKATAVFGALAAVLAAAAMLLHRYGLRVSEGTLAELAGTNPLIGTDEYALARAVERAAQNKGLRGSAARLDYEAARRLNAPFVAYVRRPGVGGHAIFIEMVEPAAVQTADPLSGTAEKMNRAAFAEEWSGVAVWLEPVR
jgi:ABC-type bacteriocin/lantibiotic exporter with double-glycine peptidase domain